jgi:hypothetical protein
MVSVTDPLKSQILTTATTAPLLIVGAPIYVDSAPTAEGTEFPGFLSLLCAYFAWRLLG